jgi:3-isopropylmalate/(R)-2-methylmalate dehydratase small subunit
MKGKVWKFGNNISTDVLAPGFSLAPFHPTPEGGIEGSKKYCLSLIRPEFPEKVEKGDIVVGGKNFGCGSSRLQAPQHLQALGVSCVLAESFGKIFFRNSISIGFPVLLCEGVTEFADDKQELEVNLETGVVKNLTTGKELKTKPLHNFIMNILEAGGILNLLAEELKESSKS